MPDDFKSYPAVQLVDVYPVPITATARYMECLVHNGSKSPNEFDFHCRSEYAHMAEVITLYQIFVNLADHSVHGMLYDQDRGSNGML